MNMIKAALNHLITELLIKLYLTWTIVSYMYIWHKYMEIVHEHRIIYAIEGLLTLTLTHWIWSRKND